MPAIADLISQAAADELALLRAGLAGPPPAPPDQPRPVPAAVFSDGTGTP